jgi:hypothetical protein
MTTANQEKQEIARKIEESKEFRKILSAYQSEHTYCDVFEYNTIGKNGATETVYLVRTKKTNSIVALVMPIFYSENSVTYDPKYMVGIHNMIAEDHPDLTIEDLVKYTVCPIFFYDGSQVVFKLFIKLSTWISKGNVGYKNPETRFLRANEMNTGLFEKFAIQKKHVLGRLLNVQVSEMTIKELWSYCEQFAKDNYPAFADKNDRTSAQKIKDITNGMFAQLYVFKQMKAKGLEVVFPYPENKDDKGVDMLVKVTNGTWIKLDVKSAKGKYLRISSMREQTQFYVVVSWSGKTPKIHGYLFKYDFFGSDVWKTQQPQEKDGMFHKELSSIQKAFIDIEKIDVLTYVLDEYELAKKRKPGKLFD